MWAMVPASVFRRPGLIGILEPLRYSEVRSTTPVLLIQSDIADNSKGLSKSILSAYEKSYN